MPQVVWHCRAMQRRSSRAKTRSRREVAGHCNGLVSFTSRPIPSSPPYSSRGWSEGGASLQHTDGWPAPPIACRNRMDPTWTQSH